MESFLQLKKLAEEKRTQSKGAIMSMEKFFQTTLQDDNFDTIVALTEMFNDLPKYRVLTMYGES